MDRYTVEVATGRQCEAHTKRGAQCSRLGTWTVFAIPFCKQHLYSYEANAWRKSGYELIKECDVPERTDSVCRGVRRST